jgi:hypothetical protein
MEKGVTEVATSPAPSHPGLGRSVETAVAQATQLAMDYIFHRSRFPYGHWRLMSAAPFVWSGGIYVTVVLYREVE